MREHDTGTILSVGGSCNGVLLAVEDMSCCSIISITYSFFFNKGNWRVRCYNSDLSAVRGKPSCSVIIQYDFFLTKRGVG